MRLAAFLVLLLIPSLALAEPAPRSLVDRVMELLGKGNLPRIDVHPQNNPVLSPTPAGPPLPPEQPGVEIARNYLPVYALGQGPAESQGGDAAETPSAILPFFASAPLTQAAPNTDTLLVMLPGSDREAAKAFAYARSAQDAAIARKPEWTADGTFIFAPQFLNPGDILSHASLWPDGGKAILRWVGEGWVWGQDSVTENNDASWAQAQGLSSYAVMDYLLLMLTTPQRFPHLQHLVIAGTGAGADFVQRYAMLGVAPDMLGQDGIDIRYVVGGARSYIYPDKNRAAKKPLGQYDNAGGPPAFNEVSEETCRAANLYPFGLDALPPYGRRQGVNDVRLRYGTRRIIYLQSAEATAPVTETTPEACALNLQGASFTERARNYFAALDHFYGDDLARAQRMYIIPRLGPDALGLWQHPCGMAALFGDGGCTADTVVNFGAE